MDNVIENFYWDVETRMLYAVTTIPDGTSLGNHTITVLQDGGESGSDTTTFTVVSTTGPQGPRGYSGSGSNGEDGVSFIWQDVWSQGEDYDVNDVVYYAGSSYIAIDDSKDKVPPDSTGDWSLMVSQGIPGESGESGVLGEQGPVGLPGVAGAPGSAGPQGAEGPAGADGMSFIWQGEWGEGADYEINDVVYYVGSAYVAVGTSTGIMPTDSPDHWVMLASQGLTGDTGEQGGKGESGIPSGVSTAGFTLSLLALLLILLAKLKVWTIG
jgi:hypothetical protein